MGTIVEPDYEKAIRDAGAVFDGLEASPRGFAITFLSWLFQDTDNRRLIAFRERFHLDRVLDEAQDEWQALLALRNWVYMQNDKGGNRVSEEVHDVYNEDMLLACNGGASFFCTHYQRLLVSVLSAMGWVARRVATDVDNERWKVFNMHAVNEVWVNSLRKWVLLDSMFDIHFARRGVPLSAYEIHREVFEGRRDEIRTHKGPKGETTDYDGRLNPNDPYGRATCKDRIPHLDKFFWRRYHQQNDVFSHCGYYGSMGTQILLMDSLYGGRNWMIARTDDKGEWTGFQKEKYSETGIVTPSIPDVYFDVNTACLVPKLSDPPLKERRLCLFGVSSFTPNLDYMEVNQDDRAWVPYAIHRRVQWPLHTGDNSLAVRMVNKLGRRGPETRLALKNVRFEDH